MTVHNLYRFRCIMETIKIVRNHVPISMYDLFKKSERKDDLLITPEPSINFAYNGAYLWNKFIEQSQLRGKFNSLSSIKCQLRNSILNAQHQHDDYHWHDMNFTTFLSNANQNISRQNWIDITLTISKSGNIRHVTLKVATHRPCTVQSLYTHTLECMELIERANSWTWRNARRQILDRSV